MKNFLQNGKTMLITVPAGGLVSGQPYVEGSKLVICVTDGAENDIIAANTSGVYSLAKKAAEAIAQGVPVYWDETEEEITATASGNVFAGYAHAAAAGADTEIAVALAPNASGLVTQAANVAQETTADGSDAATTQALANALKVTVNNTLTALKDAGIMVAD